MQCGPQQSLLTVEYTRKENLFLLGSVASFFSSMIIVNLVNFLISLNRYRLPFNHFIVLLPFDEIASVNWILNYTYQLVTNIVVGLFFSPVFPSKCY